MLRAMDSAVSGLRAHQGKLDIIGNNIANVNTAGYKSQNYSFKDAVYSTSATSSRGVAPSLTDGSGGVGGTNAAQYGYGSVTGSIATDFTSSTPTYLGGFNAAINGTGFFITKSSAGEIKITTNTDGTAVSNQGKTFSTDDEKAAAAKTNTDATSATSDILKNQEYSYTRVGQFAVDANGYIVDSNGNYVYGFRADMPSNVDTTYGAEFTTSDTSVKVPSTITADSTTQKPSDLVQGDNRVLAALRAPSVLPTTKMDDSTGKILNWTAGNYQGSAIQLKSVSISNDGVITASIQQTDGTTGNIVIGKVAVANFQNEDGLTKAGNNTFTTSKTDNTGVVTATVPGGATSRLMAGYIEASNVDLAREFSDMITTERGLQANTKIITVSDEVLQEIVNMKR